MQRQRGSIVVEVVVAVAVLGVAIVGIARLQWLIQRQQRAIQERRVARDEALNQLESLLAEPWERVTAEVAGERTLSSVAQHHLRDAAITYTVEPTSDGPPAKTLSAEISWTAIGGLREQIRLSAWKFQSEVSP